MNRYTYRPVESTKFQYASFVYKIKEITPTYIKYYTIENPGNLHVHSIKPEATFPYHRLHADEIYTIICVRWKYTWHFILAWPLSGIEVIENKELLSYLKEQHNESFPTS